jgi:death-on-curing protein
LATEPVIYLTYAEAVWLHIRLMRRLGETRYGVASRHLVESALARPEQAAAYESADLQRQAATLLYGLIKSHPWVGGNKRTATVLVEYFLSRNGVELAAAMNEMIELSLSVESDKWQIDEVEMWIRRHCKRITA